MPEASKLGVSSSLTLVTAFIHHKNYEESIHSSKGKIIAHPTAHQYQQMFSSRNYDISDTCRFITGLTFDEIKNYKLGIIHVS